MFKYMIDEENCRTYVTDAVSREQYIDNGLKQFEQFRFAPPKFVKRLGLFLKYIKDRIGIVTAIDLRGKWVVAEIFPSLLGVVRQGSIENSLKVGGCIRSRGHNGGEFGGRLEGNLKG